MPRWNVAQPATNQVLNKDLTTGLSDTYNAIDFHANIIPPDLCDNAFLSIFPHTREGLLERIPVVASRAERVEMAYLTGLDPDEVIEEPYGLCDTTDAGEGWGVCSKDCYAGRIHRGTNPIHLEEAIKRADECDIDAQLSGSLMDAWGREIFGDLDMDDPLNVVTVAELIKVAHNMEKTLRSELWIGDRIASPRNTGGGGGLSYDGLNIQISDTIISSHNSEECPDLASKVRDINYADLCAENFSATGVNAAATFENDLYEIEEKAEWAQHAPILGAFVMRGDAWHEWVKCLPCQFNDFSCNGAQNSPSVYYINDYGRSQYEIFRQRKSLTLNGFTYEVIIDNSIPYETATTTPGSLAGTERASTVYFVPFSVNGGALRTIFMRYIDFRYANRDLAEFSRRTGFSMADVVDSGYGLMTYEQMRTCYQYGLTVRPGLCLRTPQYAAKWLHVKYTPSVVTPDPYFGNA